MKYDIQKKNTARKVQYANFCVIYVTRAYFLCSYIKIPYSILGFSKLTFLMLKKELIYIKQTNLYFFKIKI